MIKYHALIISIFIMCTASGCSSLGYYTQSINGQLEILVKRQPIEQLINENRLPPEIITRLKLAREIRNFAINDLGLPDNNSYLHYADLGRNFVVWNVFATPELSLQSREWCYLIVGCLSYRGYFSEDAAHSYGNELEARGFDVFVGGVAAYSTLGWFADPVLNTMLQRGDAYLAKVIFHELAHQKVYIKNDTEINEAFADTVADVGMRRWLASNKSLTYAEFAKIQAQEDEFVELVMRYRNQLDDLYKSGIPDTQKRLNKSVIFEQMINEYRQTQTAQNGPGRYASWFATGLNNAKLMAVVTYRKYLPGFKKMLLAVDNNLERFYQLAEQLGQCTHEQRRDILLSDNFHFSCQPG
jgi:predicted aminopeptidase